MPYVKWREGARDLTPDTELPIGKNVLELKNIRDTSNYTCVAASKLGLIETHTIVKVQGKYKFFSTFFSLSYSWHEKKLSIKCKHAKLQIFKFNFHLDSLYWKTVKCSQNCRLSNLCETFQKIYPVLSIPWKNICFKKA